jgi:hypothetical protein
MYTPKKLKWDSLSEFKKFLERDTSEKIVEFSGYKLITETTEYGLLDSRLIISPKKEKVKEEPKQVVVKPKPVKEAKPAKKKTVKEVKTAKKKIVNEPKQKTKEEILAEMKARGKKVLDNKKKTKR